MSDTTLGGQIAAAAKAAGLTVVATEAGKDFSGNVTARFTLALAEGSGRTVLELSEGFDLGRAELAAEVAAYLSETAKRLKNPRPECFITLHGLPLSFEKFEWPFHGSTSGADSFLVHGEVKLEDGESNALHAKVAASMTVTFKEIVAAMEQPFAEGFIYNAVRKTMDQGQLELVKSGNRQPVPVTTRYYSTKQGKFIFNDTDEAQRSEYLKSKVYWLSGVLGGDVPVWVVDPRDAQYLNTSVAELKKTAEALASAGSIALDGEYAKPTEALRAQAEHFRTVMADSLTFIKPTFNEEMRGGHTNM